MSAPKPQLHQSLEATSPLPSSLPSWQIKLLYDGACPFCLREVNFLKKRDAGRGLVAFVDISSDDYTPAAHGGVDFATAMGRIQAVLPDGTIIRNVEVFRRVYEILGMGWIYAATKLPVIGPIVDRLYEIWADWRLVLTGRPDLATIVAEREKRLECKTQERQKIS
jgi:predicted DCC family thiol-disulfide oxidoreductase YuxK